ncbi:hypothetical protein PPYR_04389 [Photinus pyralis]|uniref:Uncharacterized protein n=2 Tax=Photinus pyralis TaxID=7054 RepID=A0A5N4AY51_PHOPY|nr:transcriptional adapter 1-like [Photinus pyralis]KAB0802203.1 hypothetical protein PPYR_04389 [Photinus pyralis]
MNDLNQARKLLEQSLGDDLKKQYFSLLKQWFLFSNSITKLQFDTAVRNLMTTKEQLHQHNDFMLALYGKINNTRAKSTRSTYDKGCFEIADSIEYLLPPSPTFMLRPEVENRSAAAELFLPDSGFIASRIAVQAWENGLEGAEEGVTDIIVQACQTFIKNIIMAMVTRKRGYKVRDSRFQYGFGTPIPDPFIRNTNHIIDTTQECKVEVGTDDDCFIPANKPSLEAAEQQAAFSYSCGSKSQSDGKLTLQLLYDTLREDPNIIGYHSVNSINLFRIGLMLEDSRND